MKKFFILFSVIIFLLGFVGLFLNNKILAQFSIPSFEVYSNQNCSCQCGSQPNNECRCPTGFNCTPYPTVENVDVIESEDLLTITAKAFDISGVFSVVAKIEDPDEQQYYLAERIMSCIGDCYLGNGDYQTSFNISELLSLGLEYEKNYYIEIFATDRLFNSSNICSNESNFCSAENKCPCYWKIKSFQLEPEEEIKNTNIDLKLVNLDYTPFNNCLNYFSNEYYAPFPHCDPDDSDTLIEAYSANFNSIVPTPIVLKAVLRDEDGNPISGETIIFKDTKYVPPDNSIGTLVNTWTAETDIDGVAIFNPTPSVFFPEDENETVHVIKAIFDGNNNFNLSYDEIGIIVLNQ